MDHVRGRPHAEGRHSSGHVHYSVIQEFASKQREGARKHSSVASFNKRTSDEQRGNKPGFARVGFRRDRQKAGGEDRQQAKRA